MSTSQIFHQHDLNSGITRAIQEQKFVACFVRDDGEESRTWEHSWLLDATAQIGGRSIGDLLSEKAVILRIEFGSKEATFLNTFCPTSKAPTLAIIHNGSVLEKLESGISEEEFVSRLSAATGIDTGLSNQENATAQQAPESGSAPSQTPAAAAQEEIQPPSSTPSSQTTQSSTSVQQILSERGPRLEAERRKREAIEKAQRVARAKERKKEQEAAAAQHSDKGKQRATNEQQEQQKARDVWIYEQKKRKDEAKVERERILAQIEADKQERKMRAQREKEAQSANIDGPMSSLVNPPTATKAAAPARRTDCCSLQVRLFDGSSIRGKFPPDADIANVVRNWVKLSSPHGGADQPYQFRQILAPQPSRSIEVGEEHHTLFDLGLVPSATLVLVPVNNFTEAYASGGPGYVGSAVNAAYSVASTGYGVLGSLLSYVPGFGGSGGTDAQQPSSRGSGPYMAGTDDRASRAQRDKNSGATAAAGSTTIRVKTLADQRAETAKKEGTEFYNGNSLRFEGRNDDDDDAKRS